MDEQKDERNFDNLINDLWYKKNDKNNSEYVPDDSDEDEKILGSRKRIICSDVQGGRHGSHR